MVVYLYEANKPPHACYLIKDDPREVHLPRLLEGLRHTSWYKTATPLEKETITRSLKDHFHTEATKSFGKAFNALADSFGEAVRAENNPRSLYKNQSIVLSVVYTILSEALKHPAKNF